MDGWMEDRRRMRRRRTEVGLGRLATSAGDKQSTSIHNEVGSTRRAISGFSRVEGGGRRVGWRRERVGCWCN